MKQPYVRDRDSGLMIPARLANPTLQQQMLVGSGDSTTDPYFASVVLLQHCQGTFVDTTGRHTFTNNGSPTGPTIVSTHTFGGQTNCGQNSRAVAQYQTIVGNTSDFSFGAGDFTFEWLRWGVCPNSIAVGPADGLFSTAPFSTAGPPYGLGIQIFSDAFQTSENVHSSSVIWSLSGSNASNWNSLALCRISGVMSFYYNGVAMGKTPQAAPENRSFTLVTTPQLWIQYSGGNFATTGGSFDGYFTEVRITKGVGRYTANYTPRTTPFPNS